MAFLCMVSFLWKEGCVQYLSFSQGKINVITRSKPSDTGIRCLYFLLSWGLNSSWTGAKIEKCWEQEERSPPFGETHSSPIIQYNNPGVCVRPCVPDWVITFLVDTYCGRTPPSHMGRKVLLFELWILALGVFWDAGFISAEYVS